MRHASAALGVEGGSELGPTVACLVTLAAVRAPREACGLVLRDRADGTMRWVELANVASDPRREFELDPAGLCAWSVREDAEPVGLWHSHPDGPARPSARDLAEAPLGWLQVVVGRDAAGGWCLRTFVPGRASAGS